MAGGMTRVHATVAFPASFAAAVSNAKNNCYNSFPGMEYCGCMYKNVNSSIGSYLSASGSDSIYESGVSADRSAYNLCSSSSGGGNNSNVWW
jgi:hypothetical protein